MPLLSVIIPAYNERATIREIVGRTVEVPIAKEIIVVDDGSTDGTAEVLAAMGRDGDLRTVRHPRNRGKGAALRTGFAHATGEILLVQDADLEYDPAQYPELIRPILQQAADVVYGSRFLAAEATGAPYRWQRAANRLLTGASNVLTGLKLTDMETGYKVFRREVIEAIGPTLKQDGFGIDPELTAKVARRGYRVCELPIRYRGRTYRSGKKIRARDAIAVLWCVLRYSRWD